MVVGGSVPERRVFPYRSVFEKSTFRLTQNSAERIIGTLTDSAGVTAPDPDAVAEAACKDGAKRLGETITMYDGDKALYLRDPWGNVVEVLSCSFEQLMGNRE